MSFQLIPQLPKELLDFAFRRARDVGSGDARDRLRAKISVISDILTERIQRVMQSCPDSDTLTP